MRSGESRFVRSKSDILGQKDTFSHVNAFTLTGPSKPRETLTAFESPVAEVAGTSIAKRYSLCPLYHSLK